MKITEIITPERMLSASASTGRYREPTLRQPKEGTGWRKLYDRFLSNPGGTVTIDDIYSKRGLGGAIEALQNYYGLDIRLVRQGGQKRGPSLYMLAGYYNGKDYTDLTIPPNDNP